MKDKNFLYADRPWYHNGDGDYIYDTKFHYGAIDIMNTASGKHKRAFAKLVFMGSNVNVMK